MTANATPACAARADKAPNMSAPLELPLVAAALPVELAPEGDPEPEGDVASVGTATTCDWELEDTAEEGETVPFEEPPGR
jgi:hypothetical protein